MVPFKVLLVTSMLLLLLLMTSCSHAAKEPRTGIEFPDKYKRTPLSKLGLRTKGPIKVYAVGQYGKHTFMLKMNYNVGAEKLSSALMDALKPRCSNCSDKIDEFHTLLLDAIPNGAKHGMELVFVTSGNKITITVDNTLIGNVSSKQLAQAFAGIYTDSNAVCKMIPVDAPEEEEGWMQEAGSIMAVFVVVTTSVLMWSLNKKNGPYRTYVSELNIYPIKSCAAQRVHHARATARGFEGDRIAQVTDENGKYCTPRDDDKCRLFQVTPHLQGNTLTVTAPNMVDYPLEIDLSKTPTTKVSVEVLEAPDKLELEDYGAAASVWMAKATGIPNCRLTGMGSTFDRTVRVNPDQGDAIPTKDPAPVSLADEAPYLLTNLSSLEDLNKRMVQRGKQPVDMRRFRPNIVVDGLKPWEEDSLKKVRIGSVTFWVWQRCGRCKMTTIDRDTLEGGPEPLQTLNTFRERAHGMRNFGMHLVPCENIGRDAVVSLGDEVEILEYDEERRSEWERLFGDLK